AFNVYNVIRNISDVLRYVLPYYQQYRKFPKFVQNLVQKFLSRVSKTVAQDFIAEVLPLLRRDIAINGILLLIAVVLNVALWYLRITF
ncbi:MAG: hypothetical protein ACR2PY_07670, partial [Salinispira sp.]